MSLNAGSRLGPYAVTAKISEGGMGATRTPHASRYSVPTGFPAATRE